MHSKHWFQMRLWTQARVMGLYAAQCMHDIARARNSAGNAEAGGGGDGVANNIVFEVFAHITRFFGYKVVLLGRYNAQGLTVRAGAGKGAAATNERSELEVFVREMVVTEHGLVEKHPSKRIHEVEDKDTDKDKDKDTDSPPASSTAPLVPEAPAHAHAHAPAPALATPAQLHDLEVWTRVSPGQEYIKVIVHCGCVVGALLLGDTELEEVFENLILNRLDVSAIGISLLDPSLDLEGYMD